MSTLMAPSSSFGPIDAHNALAGNHFSGRTTITVNGPRGDSQYRSPAVSRSIPFPRNEDLVPRNVVTNRLDQLLPGTTGYHAAALSGLGGSGKTQIALDYAYRRQSDPDCSIFWVHADSETSFTKDYQSIAGKLGLPNNLSGEDLLRAVCDKIEANPNWVLVLDNADDLTWFGVAQNLGPGSSKPRLNLNAFVPKCLAGAGTGTVLWTSRDRQIAGSLVGARRAIHIVRMTSEEAEALLNTVRNEETSEDEHDAAEELLAELDYLPLAISQAAAYMRRTSTSVEDYLSDIRRRKRRWKVLGKSEHDRFRREQASNTILETWDISVEYLRKENEQTYDVLHSLAFVDNQNIPFDLIRGAVRLGKETMAPLGKISDTDKDSEDNDYDYDDTVQVITRLCEFSFLGIRSPSQNSQAKAYDMHKLAQEAARYRSQKGKSETKGEAYFVKAAFQITSRLFPHEDEDDRDWEVRGRCEQYLAHAQQVGAWAELHNGEAEVAELLYRVADYLWVRGRWRECGAVREKVLHLRQGALGDQHLATLDSMHLVVWAYIRQERPEEAENLCRRTLRLRERVLGPKHPDTLCTIDALAAAILSQGRDDEAENLFQQALKLRQEVPGENHHGTSFSMGSLALVFQAQGKNDMAEKLYRQVIELEKEVLGRKHPDTLDIMHNLSSCLYELGRYNEACDIQEQVLKLKEEVLGRKHPDTLDSMHDLCSCLYELGRYNEAIDIQEQVLELKEEVLGRKHPDTLRSIIFLGVGLRKQGNFEASEDIYRQALGLVTEMPDTRHPRTFDIIRNLAITIQGQGRYEEAGDLFRQALEKCTDMLGRRHRKTQRFMNNLVGLLQEQGNHKEAEKIARDYSAD
ncbi:hypothetical protein F5X98DRAFT_178884 [Xylaria grammica]|nr:hypothetical protein F5X98DRAFT_178884 [Xylaria grammica]